MKQIILLFFVAVFLFVLGQSLFYQHPASSSREAVAFSADMRRRDQEHYLLEQARRFYRQGQFGEAFDLAAYAREKLGFNSSAMAELSVKSRQQLEEAALTAAEKLQQHVRDAVDLR